MTAIADTTVRVERTYEAPRADVYRAWTTVEGLSAWYAPVDGWVTEILELDVRVNGRYSLTFGPTNGPRFSESGEYRVVAPNERLVYTTTLAGPTGDVQCETLVEVSFEESGQGTRVTVVEKGYPSKEMRDRHQQGWGRFLSRLNRHGLNPVGTSLGE